MNIYRAYLRNERTSAALYALAISGFAFIIVAIFPSIAKINALREYMEQMPPFMKAFIGNDFVDFTTLDGFLTVEYFNTTWLMIVGVFSCLFSGAVVAEETEKKTIEILLSTPLSRTRFAVEKFAGYLTILAFLTIAGLAGIYIGVLTIGETMNFTLYAKVSINGFACLAAVGSIGFFFSCVFNEQRRASSITMVVFFTLYIFNVVAVLLEQYPLLKYLSLFNYYDASRVFTHGRIPATDTAVLIVVFAISFTTALIVFNKKDIYQ